MYRLEPLVDLTDLAGFMCGQLRYTDWGDTDWPDRMQAYKHIVYRGNAMEHRLEQHYGFTRFGELVLFHGAHRHSKPDKHIRRIYQDESTIDHVVAHAPRYPHDRWRDAGFKGRRRVIRDGLLRLAFQQIQIGYFNDDGIMGWCLIHCTDLKRRIGSRIVYIGVKPEARGRGVGSALLQAGLRAITTTLVAGTHDDNEAAIRLYEANGFVETGRLPIMHWWKK